MLGSTSYSKIFSYKLVFGDCHSIVAFVHFQSHFLRERCRRSQLSVGGTISERVGLGCIRTVAECDSGRKPVS